MDQLPNLGREQEMLDIMGISSMKDLFEDIPVEIRSEGILPLPPPQTEEKKYSWTQRGSWGPMSIWIVDHHSSQQDCLEILFHQWSQ